MGCPCPRMDMWSPTMEHPSAPTRQSCTRNKKRSHVSEPCQKTQLGSTEHHVCTYTHALLTHHVHHACLPTHSHTPATTKPSRSERFPLCFPELTPFSVHDGTEAGAAIHGILPVGPESNLLGSPGRHPVGPPGHGTSSQVGLDKSLLRWHLEDTVHLQPGPSHLLLAWAVGAL